VKKPVSSIINLIGFVAGAVLVLALYVALLAAVVIVAT
jgi:hypothetical protein